MSTRKIWNGSQWVQIGGEVPDQIQGITQSNFDSLSTPDSSTIYAITNASGVGVANSMRINQSLVTKMYVGATEIWSPPVYAIGGTVTDIDVGGAMWRVHTFTDSGQFEVLQPSLDIEYLIVAGGGGGGYGGGGGNFGGAGGAEQFHTVCAELQPFAGVEPPRQILVDQVEIGVGVVTLAAAGNFDGIKGKGRAHIGEDAKHLVAALDAAGIDHFDIGRQAEGDLGVGLAG